MKSVRPATRVLFYVCFWFLVFPLSTRPKPKNLDFYVDANVKVRLDFLDQIDCDFSHYHANGARRGGRRRGVRHTEGIS